MNKIADRFNIARNELLDLSLKNPLLNYKLRVSSGLEFPFLSIGDVFEYLVTNGKNISFTKEFSNNPSRLYIELDDNEMHRRLVKTYRASKLYIEEKGANTLFLALGFLKWKEKFSEVFYRAPLVLIPVDLNKFDSIDKYFLSYSGEEIRLNVSLITKMQNDFGLNFDYEYDGEIKEINRYMRYVNEVLLKSSYTDWAIESTCGALDFFSYTKFLMYKDLDLTVWLDENNNLNNPILEKLFITNFDDELTKDLDLNKDLDPTKLMTVVDADSSQAKVIFDINNGKNMVIQGPPGTGKSQTITNILASAVAHNKSVLFVAEKMAALDVVKRRLQKVGLGDLVLELHSQKANKKDVIKSIERTLNLGEVVMNDDSQMVEKYELTKNEIIEYKKILNSEFLNSSLKLVDIYGLQLAVKDYLDAENIHLPRLYFNDCYNWSLEDYNKRKEVVKEFSSLVNSMGKIEKHPFFGAKLNKCLPYEQVTIKEKINDLEDCFNSFMAIVSDMCNIFNTKLINTIFETGRIINSIDAIKKFYYLRSINCSDSHLINDREKIFNLISIGKKIQGVSNKDFDNSIYYAYNDYLSLYADYVKLTKKQKRNNLEIKKVLGSYLIKKEFNPRLNKRLYEYLSYYQYLKNNEDFLKYIFRSKYVDPIRTDWEEIEKLIPSISLFLGQVYNYSILSQTRNVILDEEKVEKLTELENVYNDTKNDFLERLQELFDLISFDYTKRFSYDKWYEDISFTELKKIIISWKTNADSIIEVVRYNGLVEQFNQYKINGLLEYYNDGGRVDCLENILAYYYFESLINKAYELYPLLQNFKEYRMKKCIELFRDLDSKLMVDNIKIILDKHYKNMPTIHDNSKEMSIIRREIQKKKNQLPIRKLFGKTGDTIQKIKPIFMMSPISVSSFLPPKEMTFDLVVFDEASQVRPVDAFGALLRAKQIVVVGDSKQLPPTSFFDSMTNKYDELDDEDFDISNMESILSLLLAKNIPQRTLSWHYRSKNQSLIALSNDEFYNHELKVFPSIHDRDPNQGLIYRYIPNSVYSRGGSRSNKIEAKEVIKSAIEHAINYPNLSLGIASFSLAQQEELYKEFDAQMKTITDPKIREFFSSNKEEPFFIKNLESVQGDERDAIFISVGYGKDEKGIFTMEFGPLNKDGGERRLNVLITRAKVKCVVFSNLTSHDIDLTKTSALGVRALKRFLEYAQNRNIYNAVNTTIDDDYFVSYIDQKLLEYDYDIDKNIGKDIGIDLAIYDMKKEEYVAGIECDREKNAIVENCTDSERIRRNVLKSLGWRVVHLYSPEYYRNPKNQFTKLLDYISESKKDDNDVEDKSIISIERLSGNGLETESKVVPYREYNGPKRRVNVLSSFDDLNQLICKIVKCETPIHLNVLKKRLMSLTNVNRLSDEQEQLINNIINGNSSFINKENFLIYNDSEVIIRNRDSLDKAIKKIDYVSDEEFIECILYSLSCGSASTIEEISKECSEYLGFSKSNRILERVGKLLDLLCKEDKIYLEENQYYIK